MSEDDISQKVKFSWNPDVKLYILFLRGPGNSGKGRWAEFYINRYNIQIPY